LLHAADAVAETARSAYQRGELLRRDGAMQPIAPDGLSQFAAAALRDLAIAHGAVRTLETGLGLGLSTLALGEAVLRSGDIGAQHTAIDPYIDWTGYAGLDLVMGSAMQPIFRHYSEQSQLLLPRMIHEGEQFDFALVDGAHWFETALMDIYFIMLLLKPGGIAVVDDPWMPAIRLAINYASSNLGCRVLPSPHTRYVVLERPEMFPMQRDWRHFVPFDDRAIEPQQ
jgi:predicted O-methyltransferase YrrM